jgi:thiamine transport system ATP-binding protein
VEVRSVLKETGTAAVFVTHDHDEAFTVADRVAVMMAAHDGERGGTDDGDGGGRLLQVAPPEELWRAPASRRVAEFLGYQAFLPLEPATGWLAIGPAGLRVVDVGDLGERRWDAVVVGSVFRRGRTEVTVDVDLAGDGTRRLAAVADGITVPDDGEKVAVELDRRGCAVVPAR